ncbi:MAG: hypothetical protein EP340_08575 [Alphaproteobacteria bacterium]|nr:MAG: hypothetical protein EP340_08575 [Alphaproteobacteria bacterium]
MIFRSLAMAFTNVRAAFLAILLLAPLSGPVLGGEDVGGIAAVVNDEVISNYDVQQRVNLVIFSSGVKAEGADLERIRNQVLRTLIDETLKIQEARELDVEITTQEVDDAIASMAADNNMTVEQIIKLLNDNNTNVTTLRRQIAADIAWETIVRGMFASRVSVTDEEVDTVYQQTLESANEAQYMVSEIVLQIESPDKDAQVKGAANDLYEQLQRGAQFANLARQFSQSASSSQGGDIGWIQQGQLAPELDAVLPSLRIGEITQPIRTVNAYYILALRNKKEAGAGDVMNAKVTLRRLVVPVDLESAQEEIAAAANYIYSLTSKVHSCNGLSALKAELPTAQLADPQEIVISQLPDTFKGAVLQLEVGQVSQPMLSQQGFQVIALCAKEDAVAELPSRDEIEGRLFNQQLSMLARRHMRDLRNDAIIDNR